MIVECVTVSAINGHFLLYDAPHSVGSLVNILQAYNGLGAFLLTWVNFNPIMDKY